MYRCSQARRALQTFWSKLLHFLPSLFTIRVFLDQKKNCIISTLSTSSRYTQHSQSTHVLSSSKSQSQTCVKNQIECHTDIRSASRLRTSAQRMATNIPVGCNEHNLLLLSCVFLLPLFATNEEERLIPIYPFTVFGSNHDI